MFHPFNSLPVDRMGGRERDLMEAESRNMRELAARRREKNLLRCFWSLLPVCIVIVKWVFPKIGVPQNGW